MSNTRIETISPTEAATGDDHVLLDVREPDEWTAGHAAGAIHVPLMDLPGSVDAIPTGRRIVCICRAGGRSARATEFLVQQGFEAVNMVGGMTAWAADGHPVVRDDGGPGSVI